MNNTRIFISYSHQGNGPKWRAALLSALHVFEQHHLLDVWQDGKIRVSSYWNDDIKQAMEEAQLAVLLLTPEALESEYILNTEFPFLQERRHRDKLPVFQVICEPCNWKNFDWLRATQAVNQSIPLSTLSRAAQEGVLRKLATDIGTEVSRVALARLPKFHQPQPDHIYLEKLPITRGHGLCEEKLIGRGQELALLDLAFAEPHTVIVSIVAWGGVGKTMLTQHWLQHFQRKGWFGARRIYAWSFYSQGTKQDRQTSEDMFLAHALEWFGVRCEPTLSPWDKGRLLADAVSSERTILALDGIEPLQFPPGPKGGQLRAPGLHSLLKHLARKSSTLSHVLCLVTTREPLSDLADFQRREGGEWGCVLRMDLGNLTDEAGAAMLHHAGARRAGAAEIKADDAELLAASHEVNGHALTLKLLGRFLARAHAGNIRRREVVNFGEADHEVQGQSTFKMLAAFESWFANSGDFGMRLLTVLRLLSLFDCPADADCIAALREPPAIVGLTDALFISSQDANAGLAAAVRPIVDEDWNTTIAFLEDFGLVTIQVAHDKTNYLLDSHPLIREHFCGRMVDNFPEAWRDAHNRLYKHMTTAAERHPSTLLGLEPLYQAVTHGCLAKEYSKACTEVYRARISRAEQYYSSRRLGAFASNLKALACFFERPWSSLASSIPEEIQGWILNETAMTLRCLGRLSEALEPLQTSFHVSVKTVQDALQELHAIVPFDISAKTLDGRVMNALQLMEDVDQLVPRGPQSKDALLKSWEARQRSFKVHEKMENLRQGLMSAALRASNTSENLLSLGYIGQAKVWAEKAVYHASLCGEVGVQVITQSVLANVNSQAGCSKDAAVQFRSAEEAQARELRQGPILVSARGFRYCELLLEAAERTAWRQTMSRRCRDFSDNGVQEYLSEKRAPDEEGPTAALVDCISVLKRLLVTRDYHNGLGTSIQDLFLTHLSSAQSMLYASILVESFHGGSAKRAGSTLTSGIAKDQDVTYSADQAQTQIDTAVEGLRCAGAAEFVCCALLTRSWIRFLKRDINGAQSDLNEAWDIAERGSMRLHMVDSYLFRARLFFREIPYPWESPRDDLAAARRLIEQCGYWRRNEELEDAEAAVKDM